MIVDDATNTGWPLFLPDKGEATVTHGFRASWRPPIPTCLRTDNSSEFISKDFERLMADDNTHREFTSVDDPKRNGRVERKLALIAEGGVAAFRSFNACSTT